MSVPKAIPALRDDTHSKIELDLVYVSGTPMETGGHLSQPGTPLGSSAIHEATPPPLEMMIFSPGKKLFFTLLLHQSFAVVNKITSCSLNWLLNGRILVKNFRRLISVANC